MWPLCCRLLSDFTPFASVGSGQPGGEGLLCPAPSSVTEQGVQGTPISAVVPAPPHPGDKGLVLFFRLLSDGQKLLTKVVFWFVCGFF